MLEPLADGVPGVGAAVGASGERGVTDDPESQRLLTEETIMRTEKLRPTRVHPTRLIKPTLHRLVGGGAILCMLLTVFATAPSPAEAQGGTEVGGTDLYVSGKDCRATGAISPSAGEWFVAFGGTCNVGGTYQELVACVGSVCTAPDTGVGASDLASGSTYFSQTRPSSIRVTIHLRCGSAPNCAGSSSATATVVFPEPACQNVVKTYTRTTYTTRYYSAYNVRTYKTFEYKTTTCGSAVTVHSPRVIRTWTKYIWKSRVQPV